MRIMGWAAGAAVVLAASVTPALGDTMSSAEKLRRLDIMLMVTGLRCRTTADNFQADFQKFEARHLDELNAASSELKASIARRSGPAGAEKALDRISVSMANQYGNGHPWLGCRELKVMTRELAEARGAEPLLAAADEVLRGDGPQLAYVH